MKTSLGLLREHVRHLLIIEGRFEDVSKKYPTAKQVSSGSEPQQVVDIVQQFHLKLPLLKNKDINSFKTTEDLTFHK